MIHCCSHSQQLLSCYAIFAFGLAESTTVIGNDVFLAMLFLREDAPYALVTGISVHNELSIAGRARQ